MRGLLEATALDGFGPGSPTSGAGAGSRARWAEGARELRTSRWGVRIKSWAGRLACLSFPPSGLCPPAPAVALLSPVWMGLGDGQVPGHARESWANTASKRGLTSGKLPQPHGRPAERGSLPRGQKEGGCGHPCPRGRCGPQPEEGGVGRQSPQQPSEEKQDLETTGALPWGQGGSPHSLPPVP